MTKATARTCLPVLGLAYNGFLAFVDILAIQQLWRSHQTHLQRTQFLKEYAAWNQSREEVYRMYRDNEYKQYDRERRQAVAEKS
jgi:hypothetical protein